MRLICARAVASLPVLLAALCLPACGTGHHGPTPASGPSVQVSPATASVLFGVDLAFTVSVSGLANTGVIWSVNGITGGNSSVGTIVPTAQGAIYLAATVPSPDVVTVMATSQADSTVSGQASVTVLFPDDTTRAQSLPIRLGTSGGNATDVSISGSAVACCSGTLGCLVRRGGDFYILSNNHVLDKSGQGNPGDTICQPGLTDNNCFAGTRVAGLTQSAPLATSNVDAALALVESGAVDLSGAILDLGAVGPTGIAPAPPSATPGDPSALLASQGRVSKVGRSTGLTCATLASIATDIKVDYSTTCAGPTAFSVTFHNQVIIAGNTFSDVGDSGALIVSADAARPIGLLFAGNGTSTAAHPIADVLSALKDPSTGEVPQIVGGPDHTVSCAAMEDARSFNSQAATVGAPTPEELSRVSAAQDRFGTAILADPAVEGLGVGTSADHPAEGALLIYLRGRPTAALPRTVGGVRTRLVWQEKSGGAGPVKATHIERARQAKELYAGELLAKPGVTAVGVGLSKDAASEPAIVIFVQRGVGVGTVDPELAGVRTQVLEGEPFRTFSWGSPDRPRPRGCCGQK